MRRAHIERTLQRAALLGMLVVLGCENDPRLVGLEHFRGTAGAGGEADAASGGSPGTGGAPGADGSVDILRLTIEDADKAVSASVGQEIDLTLGTVGAGQFGTPELSSPALEFIEMSFPPDQNPGGPTQLYRFIAVSSGTVVITLKHTVSSAVFTVKLEVQ